MLKSQYLDEFFRYWPNFLHVTMTFKGFEISDVLAIDDKDYSITFGLYFSVEWVEPRLNLSQDVWSGQEYTDTLVPGEGTS